jgi:hypothetical protein
VWWCQQNRDARELPIATKSLDLWERFAVENRRRDRVLALRPLDGWARWRDFAKTAAA